LDVQSLREDRAERRIGGDQLATTAGDQVRARRLLIAMTSAPCWASR
jgi:hypothetical protein